MKFESLLARKYIYSQKRHSLLTICSIVIAVALMTMIFTSYTTLTSIQRASHYDKMPYHMYFGDLTAEQANIIEGLPEVGTAERSDDANYAGKYALKVTYGSYIDIEIEYVQKVVDKAKIEYIHFVDTPSGTVIESDARFSMNDDLMSDDLVTLSSRFAKTISLASMFVIVIFLALALRMVIDTAFEVSAKERERQFGVLQSVGATPIQIVKIITHEGLMLSIVGVPIGALVGIGLGFGVYKAVLSSGVSDVFFTKEKAEQLVHFNVSPLMVLAAMAVGTAWVWLSAYGTGKRIIRMTPIQAISNRSNTIKKVKKHSLLGLLFGWKGKLAARNARRQPKRFVITVLSLTVSLTLYASFTGLIDAATTVVNRTFTPVDMLGIETSEMDIVNGVQNPEDNYSIWADEESVVSDAQMEQYIKDLTEYQKTLDYHDANRIPGQAEKLMATGYFKSVEYYLTYICAENYYIVFVNDASYNRIYGGEPKMSFAEFEKTGKALILEDKIEKLPDTTLSLTMKAPKEISKEEYEKAKKDESTSQSVTIFAGWRDSLEDTGIKTYAERVNVPVNVEILDYVKRTSEVGWSEDKHLVILPYSYYVNNIHTSEMLVDNMHYPSILKDDASHQYAVDYLKNSKEFYCMIDMYKDRHDANTVLSAVDIGVSAANLMIALIAIVNMINIVSTGILNRKSEFGSLQCIGMTRGQLLASTIYECIQFVLFAGIMATVLCWLMKWGTETFLFQELLLEEGDVKTSMIDFTPVFIKIWIGTAAAFIVALLASILPLKIIDRQELVDQIRTVE